MQNGTEVPDSIRTRPAISYFLTREEWLACFGACLVSFEKKTWEVNGDPAPSIEVDGVGEALRHGIRVLAHAGYSFRAIEVSLDGLEIFTKGEEPVEPRNLLFLQRFANGSMPNPLNALAYTRELALGLGLELDLDPLLELEKEIQSDVEEFSAQVTEEERMEFALFLQRALATIGVAVAPPGKGIN